jgi:hypothetical protein
MYDFRTIFRRPTRVLPWAVPGGRPLPLPVATVVGFVLRAVKRVTSYRLRMPRPVTTAATKSSMAPTAR